MTLNNVSKPNGRDNPRTPGPTEKNSNHEATGKVAGWIVIWNKQGAALAIRKSKQWNGVLKAGLHYFFFSKKYVQLGSCLWEAASYHGQVACHIQESIYAFWNFALENNKHSHPAEYLVEFNIIRVVFLQAVFLFFQ